MPIRSVLVLLITVSILASVRADEETGTPLGSLTLDYSRLESWKDLTYEFARERGGERNVLGTLTLKTIVEKQQVRFADRLQLRWQDTDCSWVAEFHCRRDAFLSTVRVKSVGEGNDEFKTFDATIADGKARIEEAGKPARTEDWPPGTLADMALYRLFALLPRDKPTTWSFPHFMEISELNLKGAAVIQYRGRYSSPTEVPRKDLHHFIYSRGGRPIMEAWLGDDGIPVRITIDGSKVLTLRRS